MNFNIELGMILEKLDELIIVVSDRGMCTNIDENFASDKLVNGFLKQLINGEDADLYQRALITTDRLEKLGFERDRSSPKYELNFGDKNVQIYFETSAQLAIGLTFKYRKSNGEFVSCQYIDEIQTLYKMENGSLLNLYIK